MVTITDKRTASGSKAFPQVEIPCGTFFYSSEFSHLFLKTDCGKVVELADGMQYSEGASWADYQPVNVEIIITGNATK